MRMVFSAGRWVAVLGAVTAVGVASAPARVGGPQQRAGSSSHRLSAHAAAARVRLGGISFGGVTSARWPVVLQVNRAGTRVTRAVIGIDTKCTSGKSFADHDGYLNLRVSRSGRFRASFGPDPNGNPAAGVTETAQGSISGRFNRARTKASGTWRLTFIDKDAGGATVDTCDSGALHWTARQ